MTEMQILYHEVEHATIAYAWSHTPAKRPLVMLHGLGDSAIHTFGHHLAKGPLAGVPILFIDLPGFGESQYTSQHPATIRRFAADVASLLDSLGIRHTDVFGHSMGGNVAIHLASHYSSLVDQLIVAEPLLNAKQSILAADIARFSEEAFTQRRFLQLVRATSLQSHRGDVAAAGFLEPLRMADPIAMHRAACSLIGEGAAESAELLKSITIPCSILIGERTPTALAGVETGRISIFRISEAGHNMLVEQAIRTSYAILDAMN